MNFEYEPNFIDAQLAYAKSQAAKKAKAKAQKPPYWLNTAKLSAKILMIAPIKTTLKTAI